LLIQGGMGRVELERLSKEELIELVLKLQRPAKTSRTYSKPPSADRKERREQSRPGGAKPGHEGHRRVRCRRRRARAIRRTLLGATWPFQAARGRLICPKSRRFL